MEQKTHNPHSKLIETTIFNGSNFLTLVWGIDNNGTNEGLEVYFKKEKDAHFYTSRRYPLSKIPSHYKRYFDALKEFAPKVKDGNKITIHINELLGQ